MDLYPSINITEELFEETSKSYEYDLTSDSEKELAHTKFEKYMREDEAPRYLYLIKCEDSNYYKIGITNDLNKRLETHQTGCPYKLKIIYYVEPDVCDFSGKEITCLERFLHKNYQHLLVRGEWFKFDYSHLSDIVFFLEYDRALQGYICSESEFEYHRKKQQIFLMNNWHISKY